MSPPRTIGVVIGPGPAAAEALRAAVGLTLRGARVEVAIAADGLAAAGPDGARAAATLAVFDHPVRLLDAAGAGPALDADVVEIWAGAATRVPRITDGPRPRLHLLRPGRRIDLAAARDGVLHLPSPPPGAPPPEPDDDAHADALLEAILAADVVLVW